MYLELNCGASMKTVNPGAFGVFPSSKLHFDGPHNTGPCISISKVSHHSSPTIVGQVIYIYICSCNVGISISSVTLSGRGVVFIWWGICCFYL